MVGNARATKQMSSDHYILFSFDQGLVVSICFFLFLFFAILSENGQLSSFLREPLVETKSKLLRSLAVRQSAIEETVGLADRSISRMRKIAGSYGVSLLDTMAALGLITKKLSRIDITHKVQYVCNALTSSASLLGTKTHDYFITNFFSSKSIDKMLRNRPKLVLII